MGGKTRGIRVAAATRVHRGQWIVFGENLSPRLATYTASNLRTGRYEDFQPPQDWQVERFSTKDLRVDVTVRYVGRKKATQADRGLAAGLEPYHPEVRAARRPINVTGELRTVAATARAVAVSGKWGEVFSELDYPAAHRRANRIRAGELATFAESGKFDAREVEDRATGRWSVWARVIEPKEDLDPNEFNMKVRVRTRTTLPARKLRPGEVLAAAAAKAKETPGEWVTVRSAPSPQAAVSLVSRIRLGQADAFAPGTGTWDADVSFAGGKNVVRVVSIPEQRPSNHDDTAGKAKRKGGGSGSGSGGRRRLSYR